MAKQPPSGEGIDITFLRTRDYRLVKELGGGACGKTVLLHDDLIDEYFVCKKFAPYSEDQRKELFTNFVREIKLLHKLHHENVVRVFNYHLYPVWFTGYILMEFVDGVDVVDYVGQNPEQVNEIFLQSVNGFAYLESQGILHRDIRPTNILVRSDGIVKIIDLGFGKKIEKSEDFNKSVNLNWWCDTPEEFLISRYDFKTEVYFVGKLFEKILSAHRISHFKYISVLGKMCQRDPKTRAASFSDVDPEIQNDQFVKFDFSPPDLKVYRSFSEEIYGYLSRVENGIKYFSDANIVIRQLEEVYRKCMLEEKVPNPSLVVNCFISGNYYYNTQSNISVKFLGEFVQLLKRVTDEKRRLILANLHTKFDCLMRYAPRVVAKDDIPF